VSESSVHLTLNPERCDGCLRCVRSCPSGALNVGASYIYVDWKRCSGCSTCVDVCERRAIELKVVQLHPGKGGAAVPLKDVSKVVVGSRAEAKELRKAAEVAAKAQAKARKVPKPAKAAARGGEPTRLASPPKRANVAPRTTPGAPPSPPTSGPAPWALADVAAVLAVLALTLVSKNVVLALGPVQLMPQVGRTVVRAFVLAAFYALQLAAFGWLARRHGTDLMAGFGLRRAQDQRSQEARPSSLGSAGLVVALFLGTETIAIGYGLAMGALGWEQPARLSSDLAAVFGGGGVGLVLSGLLVVLVAPVVEEFAFRGVVASAFRRSWGMWPAIVASSAVYAVYHLSAWLFFPTFVLGVALGWLAFTRRSLVPAIALHVLYNGVAVAAAFLAVR